ncbi:MAG: acyl-CoA carboxylase subunit beta, partial [Acidimicrobiales bacterium]|nr:acyl-CoA carboxylase subunit beta [Acidimicrobiales bacterium]
GEQFQKNKSDILEQLEEIEEFLDEAEAGGGSETTQRHRSKGKMPIRERIANVLDPDSPFLEISPLAAANSDYTVGGGFVVGIGVIANTECVILGNDPTVQAGAMTPYVVKKWMRALEIARDNHMPYVSFVESAGADLNIAAGSGKSNKSRAQVSHFAESGRFFYEMIELSKMGIPTICVVFGTATAGGAYQPGVSDYNIFIREQSKVALGGPPLVKMATGEESDDESIGGAQLHAEESGLADYLAEDEMDALRICREVVSHLDWEKADPSPSYISEEPIHNPEELLGIVDRDLRQPVDIREVISRIVDGSRFEEFKPLYGPAMVCGWSTIDGYPLGILGNNGVIFPEEAEKAAHFIQLCNRQNTPLLFLHNVPGFIVGSDFEKAGIIKKGSQLINAISNSTVPHIAVIVGKSMGAGNYGMSGRAYGNRFTFLWPTAKIAVMGPKQIAGVMSIVRRSRAERKGEEFDEEADAAIVQKVEEMQEQGSLALVATGSVSDDGIIDPRDTRTVISICLSTFRNKAIEGSQKYGVFRL